MSKFIDKMNLPQYKYFNNMLEYELERKEIVSSCLAATQLIEDKDKRGYQEGLVLLARSKGKLPDFIYTQEEDKKKCRDEISTKSIKRLVKTVEKYLGIILILNFFQGDTVKKKDYLEDSIVEKLPENKLQKLYKYDAKKNKYYKQIISIPKLVLINGELYQNYLLREFSEKELQRLDNLITEDVHFIIVIQCEEQGGTSYIVERENGELIIRTLKRHECSVMKISIPLLDGRDDLSAMLLSLLDYLIEIRKAESERRKQSRGTEGSYNLKESHPRQYVDKNSIKVYDMKGTAELDAFRFIKKRGRLGVRRRQGYEMIPHTRKGHYRHYKDGKVIYVRSTVIHKEKYEGIQSAHRINEKEEQGE